MYQHWCSCIAVSLGQCMLSWWSRRHCRYGSQVPIVSARRPPLCCWGSPKHHGRLHHRHGHVRRNGYGQRFKSTKGYPLRCVKELRRRRCPICLLSVATREILHPYPHMKVSMMPSHIICLSIPLPCLRNKVSPISLWEGTREPAPCCFLELLLPFLPELVPSCMQI